MKGKRMSFGRKSKVVEIDTESKPVQPVQNEQVEENPPKAPETDSKFGFREDLSDEVKLVLTELYGKYGAFMTPTDAANVPQIVFNADSLVLLLGQYSVSMQILNELKKLNEKVKADD